jgi:hypothetical protein
MQIGAPQVAVAQFECALRICLVLLALFLGGADVKWCELHFLASRRVPCGKFEGVGCWR